MLVFLCVDVFCVFFFKQKTAYEMRIGDWSSDVCSSDLLMAVTPTRGLWVEANLRETQLGRIHVGDRVQLSVDALPDSRFCGHRSEERRVGKECVSTCRSRW